MFTHVLLATDGSPCALRAAVAAAEIARRFESCVTVVTVYQPLSSFASEAILADYQAEGRFVEENQTEILAATGRVLREKNVPFEARRECGYPTEIIVDVASRDHCDLIVLGHRGLSGIQSLLLGSVSDRVNHLAHCPVLIVR